MEVRGWLVSEKDQLAPQAGPLHVMLTGGRLCTPDLSPQFCEFSSPQN